MGYNYRKYSNYKDITPLKNNILITNIKTMIYHVKFIIKTIIIIIIIL